MHADVKINMYTCIPNKEKTQGLWALPRQYSPVVCEVDPDTWKNRSTSKGRFEKSQMGPLTFEVAAIETASMSGSES